MDTKVRVCVRCRPLFTREVSCKSLSLQGNQIHADIGKGKKYRFDKLYDKESNQGELYDDSVKSMVDGCFKGYNATVLAYGQSGTGKTWTMGTVADTLAADEEGIIQRSLRQIFTTISTEFYYCVVNTRVSYIEIYNEECKDLLHPEIRSRDIIIRGDGDGKIFFTGARDEVVHNYEEACEYLRRGSISRSTGDTLMNQTSSRSHAIFSIAIEILNVKEGGPDTETSVDAVDEDGEADRGNSSCIVNAKLHLVDLAGSERAKRTGATGARLKESVGINQDSLGGNSRTVMIACISPAEADLQETLSTLDYASRAQSVRNQVTANVVVAAPVPSRFSPEEEYAREEMLLKLTEQILYLQSELKEAQQFQIMHITNKFNGKNDNRTLTSQSIPVADSGPQMPLEAKSYAKMKKKISSTSAAIEKIMNIFVDLGSHISDDAGQALLLEGYELGKEVLPQLKDMKKELKKTEESCTYPQQPGPQNQDGDALGLTLSASQAFIQTTQITSVNALKEELEACKADLKRDEEIFADKAKSLKAARREVKQLQANVKSLQEMLNSCQEELLMAKQQAMAHDNGRPCVSLSPAHAQEDRLSYAMEEVCENEGRNESTTDARVGDLMQDLQNVNHEMERLLSEKAVVESRFEKASDLAAEQQAEFDETKSLHKRRLKELEISMRLKQTVISNLAKAQSDANALADKHESRANELEIVTSELKKKIRRLEEEDLKRNDITLELAEAKLKRDEHERVLEDTKMKLETMKALRKKKESAFRDVEVRRKEDRKAYEATEDELSLLKKEHQKLSTQLEQEEQRQRKHLDSLTHEVVTLRKNSAASQKQIKAVEKKNQELLNRLNKVRHSTPVAAGPATPGSVKRPKKKPMDSTDEPDANSVVVENDGNSSVVRDHASPRAKVIGDGKAKQNRGGTLAYDSKSMKVLVKFLMDGVQTIASSCRNREKKNMLKQQLHECMSEQAGIRKELKKLDHRKAKDESAVEQQLQELSGRMGLLKQHIEPDRAGEKAGKVTTQLKHYQEHYEELLARRKIGILDTNTRARYAEIKDELESMNVEVELLETKIREVDVNDQRIQSTDKLAWKKAHELPAGKKKLQSGGYMVEHAACGVFSSSFLQWLDGWKTIPTKYLAIDYPPQSSESTAQNTAEFNEFLSLEIAYLRQEYCKLESNGDSVNGNSGDSSETNDIIFSVIGVLVLQALRTANERDDAEEVKSRVDLLESDREGLIQSLHSCRVEGSQRFEGLKKENEDKIAYLLQQLRAAEQKSLLVVAPRDHNVKASPTSPRSAKDSLDSDSSSSSRLPTHPSTRDSGVAYSFIRNSSNYSGDRRISDIGLKETALKQSQSISGDSDVSVEVVRRWENERERREQLERKNSELIRELRLVKQNQMRNR